MQVEGGWITTIVAHHLCYEIAQTPASLGQDSQISPSLNPSTSLVRRNTGLRHP